MEDIKKWIDDNKNAVMAALAALGIAFLALNAPLAILIGVVAIVIANWEGLKTIVENVAKAINDFFTITLPGWWEDKVVTPIKNAWRSVTDAVNSAINAVKAFFGLDGEAPSIKPYNPAEEGVVLSPNSKKSMDALLNYMMNPPSANEENTESVDWRADGAIFNKPTIFNTRMGLQGVGEAGAEAVAPISKLQEYVSSAVQNTVGNMQFNIVLDSGVLVGQLAPQMDAKLGTMTARKGRRG